MWIARSERLHFYVPSMIRFSVLGVQKLFDIINSSVRYKRKYRINIEKFDFLVQPTNCNFCYNLQALKSPPEISTFSFLSFLSNSTLERQVAWMIYKWSRLFSPMIFWNILILFGQNLKLVSKLIPTWHNIIFENKHNTGTVEAVLSAHDSLVADPFNRWYMY